MDDTHSLNIGCMLVPHLLVAINSSIGDKYRDRHAIKYRYLYINTPPLKNKSLHIYQLTSPMIY